MNSYFLAAPVVRVKPQTRVSEPIPKITLESMNGRHSIPIDGSAGWIRMPGATGFDMPPVEVISESLPDVDGSTVKEVRVLARPVFLPIYYRSDSSHVDFLAMKDQLRRIIDPKTQSFRIIGTTARGQRELVVTYTGGLEGNDAPGEEGASWGKVGISAVAHQPFAQSRVIRSLDFGQSGVDTPPFIGQVGGTDAPWPPALVSSAVIGDNMEVFINSDVPVHPSLEMTGPMSSFEADLSPLVVHSDGSTTVVEDQEWYIDIPLGVPADQTFSLVTDPTAFEARLNGVFAAGRISLGSTLRPFHPGLNILNVSAPGITDASSIRLSWRERFWSLW